MKETTSESGNDSMDDQPSQHSRNDSQSENEEERLPENNQLGDAPVDDGENQSQDDQPHDDPPGETAEETQSEPSTRPEDTENGTEQKVEQAIKADSPNLLNAIAKAETVKIFMGSEEKMSGEKPFVDPTIPLPERSTKLPLFDSPDQIEKYFQELKDERILVVNCLDEKIALAAAYTIVEKIENAGRYEKRILTFDSITANRSDLDLDIFFHQKLGQGNSVITFIDLKSQIFIDSMFVGAAYATIVRRELRANDLMLLGLGKTDITQEDRTGSQSQFHFPQWNIDFLPHLLRQFFPREEAEYFNEKINNQRKSGLWDEDENESEFFGLISNYLRNGISEFRKAVAERDQIKNGTNKTENFKLPEKIKPQDHIKDNTPLQNTIFYVATHFPGLSPLDFSHIVLLLLGDKKTTVDTESRVINENKEIKIVKSQIEKNLSDIWEENPDKAMRGCFLLTNLAEDLSAVVEFSPSFSRNSCKNFLSQSYPMFLRQQFASIQESGILFDFNATKPVIDNVIRISAEMAVSDPTYYGKDWLFGLVVGLKQYLNIDLEPADEVEQFFQLLAKIELKQVRKQFSARLSELIREMLKQPHLRNMVRSFLNDLIKTQYGDIALEIVVEITKRLQFAPHFDPLFWLKRFLDQGDEDTRNEAYIALLKLARKRGFRIYEVLKIISSWLPEPSKKTTRYSLSEGYALAFIIHYCISLRFKIENYGEWPPSYPLFATLKEDEESTESVPELNFLIQWLFHPGMKAVFDDLTVDIIYIIADLVEEWITILYGFEKEAMHAGVIALSEDLLKLIVAGSEDKQQKELLRRWQRKPALYLNAIKHLSRTSENAKKYLEEKEQFIRRRAIVIDIAKRFKKLQLN